MKSTLKITSAMRLIASAKLHGAQNAVENMVPYEKALGHILSQILSSSKDIKAIERFLPGDKESQEYPSDATSGRTAVLLVTSNQTLCGGFNASLMHAFEGQGFPTDSTTVFAIGKYGLKNARKMGYDTLDRCSMSAHADFDASAALADALVKDFLEGKVNRVKMIYAHFASPLSQPVLVKQFLPLSIDSLHSEGGAVSEDFIMEPSPEEMLRDLLPQELRLQIHSMLLDAAAAEHAARTQAMQVASDNATELIGELSLQYNKLRQQAITNEILDLLGGQTN